MKRYVHNNSDVTIIRIYVNVYDDSNYVAAAGQENFDKMEKHPSINKKHKRTDAWLSELNDLAASVFMALKGRNFNIIRQWYSKKSYTYYYRFQPVDVNGQLIDKEYEIQIELRDHPSSTHEDHGLVTPNLVIKSYDLDDERYSNRIQLLKAVWHLLDELQKGNFDVLDE